MGLSSRFDLEMAGFSGFLRISELRKGTGAIPHGPGVYSILWEGQSAPNFLEVGTGGWFKGVDPNVSLPTLERNWVAGCQVVYIGKAAGGSSGKRGLLKRLTEYLDFGNGRPVGHRGGRFIWQLKDSDDLIVCWKEVPTSPEAIETEMLHAFTLQYGRLPFANLRH
jgi:hypothetical protein